MMFGSAFCWLFEPSLELVGKKRAVCTAHAPQSRRAPSNSVSGRPPPRRQRKRTGPRLGTARQSREPWRSRARLHAGMAPPISLNSREESGLRGPSPRESPEGEAALAQCGRWAGREMRRPRSGAAPRAGCRSYAVGARRCGGRSREDSFPLRGCRKETWSALPRGSEVLAPAPRCATVGEAPLRQGLAPPPGAGPRRHGLVGAGAGRRAVRAAGGAARPRRALFGGGVLLQGELGTAESVGEAEGRVPVRFPSRAPGTPTAIGASATRGRFAHSVGVTASPGAVRTGGARLGLPWPR